LVTERVFRQALTSQCKGFKELIDNTELYALAP